MIIACSAPASGTHGGEAELCCGPSGSLPAIANELWQEGLGDSTLLRIRLGLGEGLPRGGIRLADPAQTRYAADEDKSQAVTDSPGCGINVSERISTTESRERHRGRS